MCWHWQVVIHRCICTMWKILLPSEDVVGAVDQSLELIFHPIHNGCIATVVSSKMPQTKSFYLLLYVCTCTDHTSPFCRWIWIEFFWCNDGQTTKIHHCYERRGLGFLEFNIRLAGARIVAQHTRWYRRCSLWSFPFRYGGGFQRYIWQSQTVALSMRTCSAETCA